MICNWIVQIYFHLGCWKFDSKGIHSEFINNLVLPEFIGMKSDLDELIELYEAERQYLQDCIKDNVGGWEYLHAHYHSEALFKINSQLTIFYKLRDPFYDKRIELERMILMYEAIIKRRGITDNDSYYAKEVSNYQAQLQKLNDEKGKPLFDGQEIDDALFSLLEGAHNGFVFYLNVENNLGFTFELSESGFLDISITLKSILGIDYFFSLEDDDPDPLIRFKELGFLLNVSGNKLVYRYDMRNFKDAIRIKTLLSRIIYDIFTHADFDSPASMMFF